MAEGLGGFSRWARGMGQKPLQLTTGQRGVRRVKHLWRDHGAPGLQQAKAGITVSFVAKVRLHAVLGRSSRTGWGLAAWVWREVLSGIVSANMQAGQEASDCSKKRHTSLAKH